MKDPLETVEVTLGGASFSGWSEVSIDISVEQAARSASLTISDYGGNLRIKPDMPCVLRASGDLLLTGFVRDVSPSHDGNQHQVQIGIISKTVDLVEASIDHPTGFVEKMDVGEIGKTFDTDGIGVEVDESFPQEPRRFVNTGESWFYHMEPLVRSHSGFIYDTPEGTIRIAKKPRGRHSGALMIGDGGNIIAASAKLTGKGRHNPVIVRGQSSRGTGKGALRIEARASDGGVGRRRPRIIIHESEATSGKLQDRADRQVKRAAGRSREAQITVAGWRDQGGRLFEPHFLIAVRDPRIYIDQDMGIKSIRFTQTMTGEGTRTELSLCDPRALNGEAPSGGSSDEVWNTPDIETSIGTAQ